MRKMCLILSLSVLALAMVSCGTDDRSFGYPREETLYVGGLQWGSPTTFNPLAWWSAFPIMEGGNNTVTYEPLVLFNSFTSEMEPLLGTIYEESNEYISVIMNSAARWSDNRPLTAEDVKYTYELARDNSVLYSGVWEHLTDITIDTVNVDTLADIVLPDDHYGQHERITFHMEGAAQQNPLAVYGALQSVRILPKHFFAEKLEELDGDFEALRSLTLGDSPIISGPYQIHNYTNERIILKRRDDYWGNDALFAGEEPGPRYILHPILEGNSHFNLALQQGRIDVTSTYLPRVWTRRDMGVQTWYEEQPYYMAGSIPTLVLNTEHEELSSKYMRRAIASAINYEDVRDLAISGYSEDIQPGLILPFGNEKQYFSAEDAEKYGTSFDKEKARSYLEKAGYTSVWHDDGRLSHMENEDGEPVRSLRIMCPSGWTDWEAIVRIVVRDLRRAGIDAYQDFVDQGVYRESQPVGRFDMILFTPAPELSPTTPLSRLEGVMSSQFWAPIGDRMEENYGRYNNPESDTYNPAVDSLIKNIPLITNQDSLVDAYRKLNRIFMKDQPAIPLAYRPEQYYQFTEAVWENFPHADNPVGPQLVPTIGAARNVLWKLRSTEKGE
ncbi:ABC transporter substrate-binding protein [Chitinivibrio alkaliphilus]|uniref:ABC transporter substrate-binding protein n=1 Tax=Chitinivibrio alkaliphilus ACht1 TaxID=1313304 RepID=U7DAL0_9BACT|nr:ABC transporter substrate-binding protein [Chitinivibrio alkaliphilus]ERP32167.1 ABC transporter substrate-binding protein [Chitinivibrio alkaliphilus ACht1]